MAARYDALVAKVRDWVNRDSETLPDAIIFDALEYAADTIYRELRIPALEASCQFEPSDIISTSSTDALLATIPFTLPDNTSVIPIPQDLSEFIQLKISGVVGQSGGLTRPGADIVINEKADLRTFEDFYSERYDYYVWTRKGDYIMFRPAVSGAISRANDATIELYYYRRLPALDARFNVSAANRNDTNHAQYVTRVTDSTPAPAGVTAEPLYLLTVSGTPTNTATTAATSAYYDTMALATTAMGNLPAGQTGVITTEMYFGLEPNNWLRDENEKALLFGALHQCFDYLGEDQMSAKYAQKAVTEVQQLNAEEGQRRNSGGNQQVNFNGLNLI